ncbi:MAG: hypothetical protein VX112_04985 [Pseudomonadota bacterium]|nr:hypothetical protein [Pseudomonadota bacterium]
MPLLTNTHISLSSRICTIFNAFFTKPRKQSEDNEPQSCQNHVDTNDYSNIGKMMLEVCNRDCIDYTLSFLSIRDIMQLCKSDKSMLMALDDPEKENTLNTTITPLFQALKRHYSLWKNRVRKYPLNPFLTGDRLLIHDGVATAQVHSKFAKYDNKNINTDTNTTQVIIRNYSLALEKNGRIKLKKIHGGDKDAFSIENIERWQNNHDIRFKQITGHSYHFLLLSQDGKVYALGCNKYQQLGNDVTKFFTIPKEITSITKPIKYISTSKTSSAVISKDGQVYTFGSINLVLPIAVEANSEKTLRATPTHRNTPVNTSFKRITVCNQHLLGICKNNKIWGLGTNDNNQLGIINPRELDINNNPELLNSTIQTNFRELLNNNTGLFNDGDQPKEIYCNKVQTFVVTEHGHVLACGKNISGSMGAKVQKDKIISWQKIFISDKENKILNLTTYYRPQIDSENTCCTLLVNENRSIFWAGRIFQSNNPNDQAEEVHHFKKFNPKMPSMHLQLPTKNLRKISNS